MPRVEGAIMAIGEEERQCPLCDGLALPESEAGVYGCERCRSRSRFDGELLTAMDIPDYHLRLEELRRRNQELVALIEAESGRGAERDMPMLRSLHEERQRVLSEYSFLCYFQEFVDRW
jgi:hypothetical protein